MNGKTGGNRGARRAAGLAVVAAVAVLAACGGSPTPHGGSPTPHGGSSSSSDGSASTETATYRADLAYAHCMQTPGVPDFPAPKPSGDISISGQPRGNSPAARANDACEHLLAAGSTGTGSATAAAMASPPGAATADCLGSQSCYTPQQYRVAYRVQPLVA